jgi:hypothetical protein
MGQRAVVTDYFVVQVKSTTDPWVFETREAVKWVVDYPIPLFLACLDKRQGILRVYQITARFQAGLGGHLPDRLELYPEDIELGGVANWEDGKSFPLSAPILRVTLEDLINEETMLSLREVFTRWVEIDRENCALRRMGLFRFRNPDSYKVNQIPGLSIVEMGNAEPDLAHLRPGILTTAESAECIGGQIGRKGDRMGALLATLLIDHLQSKYPDVFEKEVRWRTGIPGDLQTIVLRGLYEKLPGSSSLYDGLKTVMSELRAVPIVKQFLGE